MAEISIEVKDLVKIYNASTVEVFALRGLNAKFYAGQIAVIEGSSGCGKSTLVNIIGGLDRQSAGNVFYYEIPKNGESHDSLIEEHEKIALTEMNNDQLEIFRREKIGIVFQFMNLIPTLTALENVELPLLFQNVSEKEKKVRAEKLLVETKIDHRANHKPGQMSGGEQQRVAIAAALINDPMVIIADEPTGNLDTKTAREIIDLFQSIKDAHPDKTIIIVSHDRAFRRIADRILFIKDGVIIDERIPDQITQSDEMSPAATEEIQKYQQRIIELEQKLNRLQKVFNNE